MSNLTPLEEMKFNHLTKNIYAGKNETVRMTYEEIIELAKLSQNFLNDLPPLDPAYQHFFNQKNLWWDYAELLHKKDDLNLWLHTTEHAFLAADDVVVEEFTLKINKRHTRVPDLLRVAKYDFGNRHHGFRGKVEVLLLDSLIK